MASAIRLFMMFACFGTGFGLLEPSNSCSRIDFEEKMLQKMVLLEHTVKTTLSSVNAKLEEFSTEKAKLLEEIEAFKVGQKEEIDAFRVGQKEEFGAFNVAADDVMKQQTTQQEQFLKEISSKYDTMVRQTDGRIQQIQADVLNTTETLKETAGQTPVAFIARFAKDTQPVAGNVLIFNTIELNVGDAYDTTDGMFTAPVAGTYTFSVQVCMAKDKTIKYNIQSKTTMYSASYYGDKGYHDVCTSVSTVAVLPAGEEIWVQCTATDSSATDLVLRTYRGDWVWAPRYKRTGLTYPTSRVDRWGIPGRPTK